MSAVNPYQASALSRMTSRSRTAPSPLAKIRPIFLDCSAPCEALYAGPIDEIRFPAALPSVSTIRASFPVGAPALQVFGAVNDGSVEEARDGGVEPHVALVLDLGRNCDIGRLELYGNPMLPLLDVDGRPLHNAGLPRSIGVAVAEELITAEDLHRQPRLRYWRSAEGMPFHSRYQARDVRALAGWTPICPPPTYGRYLLLMFADLPVVMHGGRERRGLDIQRLLVYPFLEDSAHTPDIEYAPVSSRQTAFSAPSYYWSLLNEPAPGEAGHQSVLLSADGALCPPSALCLAPGSRGATPEYSSDFVALDGTETVALTVAATTDEIPLVSALDLLPSPITKRSFKLPSEVVPTDDVRYEVQVLATNDPEAAWSVDDAHPSWRIVVESAVLDRDQVIAAHVEFAEPCRCRYLRLRVRLRRRESTPANATHARFALAELLLLRARDFWISPEPNQDIRVDLVLMRLHGASLTDDYAFVDGEGGMALVLEVRRGEESFVQLKAVRTLLDLVENTTVRPIANGRISERRVQRVREHVTGTTAGDHFSTSGGVTDNAVSLHPDSPAGANVTVSRTGTYTRHGRDASLMLTELGGTPTVEFTPLPADRVRTRRTYADSQPLPNPFDSLDILQTVEEVRQFVEGMDQSGPPVSVGTGFNLSIGGAAGITGSGGASYTVGMQVGGGTTFSEVTGDQASGAWAQTEVVRQDLNQRVVSESKIEGTRSGTVDDHRVIDRIDESEEQRGRAVSVRYGGVYEDILLVNWPVQRLLEGHSGDALRLRVDHLPPGVRIDVEFRGTVFPRNEARPDV